MGDFYFERECRTPSSECYTIFEDDEEVGRLDLHFTPTMVHASLFVHERLTQDAIQELVQVIDEELLDAVGVNREDFIVHVHQGRDLGVLSEGGMGEDTNHEEPA
ncbi:MAG: hypothetical protein ACK4K2_05160 [Dehalococcoidia bacterium]